ncbi:MAG: MFS transporter [Spirosomaceae bacterium]|nr:MFS transporter [Spirosomataceae bacterium]
MIKKQKPNLTSAQIWNMSFGFMGIQMGFALQNANASRILQNFGADVEHLSWFWLVAPLTGMIVQPIIGHYSDKTWTKLGRRRPFFLAGAILASIGLILMPNADLFVSFLPALWVGAGFLMIMDASFNIAMEPFRALVADKLNDTQRTKGFAVQTILIGIGAVVGSWLPYVLTEWFGFEKSAENGKVPFSLVLSFIIGAISLLFCIIWTVLKTKEYSPKEQAEFEGDTHSSVESGSLLDIFKDFGSMPKTMKQLGLVQFFSWFGLFSMWVFTTPAIAQHVYKLSSSDTNSIAYNEAGNWVGVIFGIYNFVSAIYAFFLPSISDKVGRKQTHFISLIIGGLSLISIFFIGDYKLLILPMIGVGIAWASILAMPYITIPQIINGVIGGPIVKNLYGGQAIYAVMMGGVCFIIAAICVRFVEDTEK